MVSLSFSSLISRSILLSRFFSISRNLSVVTVVLPGTIVSTFIVDVNPLFKSVLLMVSVLFEFSSRILLVMERALRLLENVAA